MRELKFRTWNPVAKKMFYGVECYIFNSDSGLEAKVLWNGEEADQIIQQYTGLKDKNGKEIYEGDIVAYGSTTQYYESVVAYKAPSHIGQNFYFKYDSSNFKDSPRWEEYWPKNKEAFLMDCYRCDMTLSGYNYIEVIGNIFENSELLNTIV